MHMYLLVSHMGSVMASSESYKWQQGRTSVLPLLVASSFCRASIVLGQTVASGVKANLQVIQVPVFVKTTLLLSSWSSTLKALPVEE